MADDLPSGTVTFLFTDIEGSTRLLREVGRHVYAARLAAHHEVIDAAVAFNEGHVVDTQGDAFFCVFRDASNALAAAVQAQRGLAADPHLPRVRMGIHTGGATLGNGRYIGVSVHRAQRVCSAAYGGQILLSSATSEVVADDPPRGVNLVDLGEHELKDLDRPARLFQASIDGLPSDFPPPRTKAADPAAGPAAPRRPVVSTQFASIVGVVAILAAVPIVYSVMRDDSSGPTISRIGANSLGVIDPARNKIVDEVPVGNTPTQVAVGGDSVWVANAGDRSAMQVDPETGTVERTRDTELNGLALTAAETGMWEGGSVGHRFAVARVDAGYGSVTGPKQFAEDFAYLRVGATFGIAVMNGSLWLAEGANFVEADPRTLRVRSRRTDADRFAIDMVSGGGSLWILNGVGASSVSAESGTGQGTVTEVDPRTGFIGATISVGPDPVAIAYGAGSVWVGLSSGAIVRFDPEEQVPASTDPNAAGLVDLAVGEGFVWVARRGAPRVDRIDPKTLETTKTIDVGTTPSSIAVGLGKVLVTAY